MTPTRFSLWMLGAMVCLPFLVPIHVAPIGTFYSEWLACALGLAATPVLFSRHQPAFWPAVGYLPLLLVGVLLAQTLSGLLPYAETGLLAMLYLIWAALVMIVASTLKERLGLAAVAEHLAIWILAGAVVNALVGFMAHSGIHSVWIMPDKEHSLFGNLAQRNHFGHQLWLGILSGLFLSARNRLPRYLLLLLLCVLLPAAALSVSRAAMLYAIWMAGISHYFGGLGGFRRCRIVAIAYLACAILLPLVPSWEDTAPTIRMTDEASSFGGVRPALFLIGWEMFLQSPWLGNGFGSFARESFNLAASQPDWIGKGEHAHNLVAQLLGELGIFAGLGTAIAFFAWARHALKARLEPETGWLVGIAGIVLIHSLVEYPLWYSYFLGVFAVMLALGEVKPRPLRLGPLAIIGPVVMGAAICGLLLRDYLLLQTLGGPVRGRVSDLVATIQRRSDTMLELRKGSLLKPYVDSAFLTLMMPASSGLQSKATLCRINLAFQPTAPAVFSCALIYRLAGADRDAERLWTSANRAFPELAKGYVDTIEPLLDEDDLRTLRPLLSPVNARESP